MSVSDFQPVIGLEVHGQLLTRSKIFCGCSTEFGAPPNAHTCAVCLGMPGVLPVLNVRVVELAIRAGLALGCRINPARRASLHPDRQRARSASRPAARRPAGCTDIYTARTVCILRIHLEEDGKNVHDVGGGESLVDSTARDAVVEIVSEPDLRSSVAAVEYLKALRDVLVYLEVNDGNLEEGSFRCDANVSVMRKGATEYGQRVELKNINSFRFVQKAIDYEIGRQVELIESGSKVAQETRLFDAVKGETRSMRSKEDAHDYRYFPEPDLPPLRIPPGLVERIAKELPELPRAKLQRLEKEYGLTAYEAKILVAERALADLFERVAKEYGGPAKKLANWFTASCSASSEEGTALSALRFGPEHFAGAAEDGRCRRALQQRRQGRLHRDVPLRPGAWTSPGRRSLTQVRTPARWTRRSTRC
jgi:aspartyl-tRNA(Asn)/glutamyl-tRNA(Gln) amidotransferase subunit B